jgi:hypothetical protein
MHKTFPCAHTHTPYILQKARAHAHTYTPQSSIANTACKVRAPHLRKLSCAAVQKQSICKMSVHGLTCCATIDDSHKAKYVHQHTHTIFTEARETEHTHPHTMFRESARAHTISREREHTHTHTILTETREREHTHTHNTYRGKRDRAHAHTHHIYYRERAPNRGSFKLGSTQQIPDLDSRAHRAYMQFHNQERQLISLCEIQKCHAARDTDRNSSAGCSRFPLLYLMYSLFRASHATKLNASGAALVAYGCIAYATQQS